MTEFTTRRRIPLATAARWALWPAMLVAGIAAESFIWRSGQPPQYVVYDLAVGFLTVFVTLAIWEARPRNLVGPLLFVWAAWFVLSPVRYAHVPAVVAISWMVAGITGVCFAHAMLCYPTGRLPGRLERVVVGFAYVALITFHGLQLLWSPVSDYFSGDLCCESPPPFLGVQQPLADDVALTQTITLSLLLVVFMALVVRRLRRARPRQRRLLRPVAIVAFLFAVKTLAENFLPAHAGGPWDAPDLADHILTLAVAVVFLLGTYGSRVARANVADLVARLGGAAPGELEPMLAEALGDPDVRLDLDPAAVEGSGSNGQMSTPIRSGSAELLAVLHHDRSVLDDPKLLTSVVAATRLALENAQLHSQVLAQLHEVQASRARLVQASDAERRRLERNLHDGAQQRLLSLGLALQLAQQSDAEASEEKRALLADAQQELTAALGELRELGRGINPAVLADHGLASAVHTLANRCTVPVEVERVPDQRLAPDLETTAYYVISEALQNVVKHAAAEHVTISVDQRPGALRVVVADDGCGLAVIRPGGGLHGLVDRVEAVSGTLTVDSTPGAGTRLIVELPCASS